MARKLGDKPVMRHRALALLDQGMTANQAAEKLWKKYHSDTSLENVKKAYFPSRGTYAITHLGGKPRGEILAKMASWKANAERSAERMRRLHQDQQFKEANAERSAERMRRLHQDPQFREANAERMRRLRQDSDVEARRIAGIRRFWDFYRSRKAAVLRVSTGFEMERVVPVSGDETLDLVAHQLLHEEIVNAMRALEPVERAVVSDEFDLDAPHKEDLSQLADEERTRVLKQAFEKLRKNRRLKDWLG